MRGNKSKTEFSVGVEFGFGKRSMCRRICENIGVSREDLS